MKIKQLIQVTAIFTLLIITGCSNLKKKESMPNILWISAEDIGPAFGCYGDEYAFTPNIDKLAQHGIVFTSAYASAPICAPARSALITGIYATSTGTQHLRSEIPVPDNLKILPEFLRSAGFYCTNNAKTDYNFDPTGRWDENGNTAHWKNRPDKKPFFSVFNYGVTHEGNSNKFISSDSEGPGVHDPAEAELPPYYPDTEEFRVIWSHVYDLITKFDSLVGERVRELSEAGELENTIIFIFSDHGFGLPRYKRWCYLSGIHVPLVVYVPDKYRSLFESPAGEKDNSLISFVDFAPTVMQLAGLEPDPSMQGKPFAGQKATKNDYIYGARSRADDVYDISRLVTDGRYVYIRNFMPYKPYIQEALIFNDSKRSFKELRKLKEANLLNDTILRMFRPKASEELYDLDSDPFELNNLAHDPQFNTQLNELRSRLKNSLIEKKDIGFLHESEMMIRSENSAPYTLAQDIISYNAEEVIDAAFLASEKNQDDSVIIDLLKNPDSGIRFWGLNTILNQGHPSGALNPIIENLTEDASPAVAILASEISILQNINKEKGLAVLGAYLKDDRPWVVLNAAISIRRIGSRALPILPLVQTEAEQYYGETGGGYKNWSYPMFIGFALDQVKLNCGKSRTN